MKGYIVNNMFTVVTNDDVQAKIVVHLHDPSLEGTYIDLDEHRSIGSDLREIDVELVPQKQGAQHCNVNVMTREKLIEAIENPDKYPQLTIRVSGYCVNVHSMTPEQQRDVIARTFTTTM